MLVDGEKYLNEATEGNSTFTIPVTLNANNTISARTVAMSAPHWVEYTIYPYLAETGKENESGTKTSAQKTERQNTKDKDKNKDRKDNKEVSEIIGLGEAEEIPMKYAEYCRLYRYMMKRADRSPNRRVKSRRHSIKTAPSAICWCRREQKFRQGWTRK